MLFIYKKFLCTLFRLIFIDLQNVGVISAAPCIRYKLILQVRESTYIFIR